MPKYPKPFPKKGKDDKNDKKSGKDKKVPAFLMKKKGK